MGRRSGSDDDHDLKKSKKKKKRRSRSRSSSSGSSRYSSKHKKSKKTKHKKRSRSRSRERPSRRSRSRSRGRRSRSKDRYRSRSRSRERFRTRSRSRDRYRSRSRDRYVRRRSRSDSRSRGRRSRSDSRSRSRRSGSRSRGRRSRTPDKKKSRSRKESPSPKDVQADIREQIPGFDDMTPGEQANARMKLALKAAAAADEKIREQLGTGLSTSEEMTNFSNAVIDIEKANFTPTAFKSSRGDKVKTEPVDDGYTTHEQAIFGAGRINIKLEPMKPVYVEPDSYAHPNLYCDPDEKMERWIQKLSAMRKRKLEGEAL